MRCVDTSKKPGSPSSTTGSTPRPEPLDLDGLPWASPELAEALERNRPGSISLEEYAQFLKQFTWTKEQHASRPPASGPRFTLD